MHDDCKTSEGTERLKPDVASTGRRTCLRLSLPSSVIALLLIAVLLAVLMPLFPLHGRRLARQTQCSSNIMHIASALRNYHNVHKTFPCAVTFANDGTPMHSWCVSLLPYLVQNPLYDAYNLREPWDGPTNGPMADDVPDSWGGKYGTMLLDADYFGYRCPMYPRHKTGCVRTT